MSETNTAAAEAGQEFLRKLAARASADADFRRQLEGNPGAFFSAVGLDLPAGTRFVCTPATPQTAADVAARSTPTEIHIPIVEGTDGDRAEGELSDEQLEQVSGGRFMQGVLATIGFPIAVVANWAGGSKNFGEAVQRAGNSVKNSWEDM